MDKNTITGIILIFAIFIGFSVYNGNKMNKSYKAAIEVADSLYAKGDLENARAEYINALRYKPNQPEAVAKVSEINRQLGFVPAQEKADSTGILKKTFRNRLLL
jgi:predicted negative regulator of RcsB-dependent stress response